MHYWRNLLAKILRVSYKETHLETRGFTCDSPEIKQHLERIGATFLDGYHTALHEDSVASITNGLDRLPKFVRGFAFEGAAMSCTLTDSMTPFSRRSRLLELMKSVQGQRHLYMLHVGVGWAFARLPGNPELKIGNFDPLLRWLIIDGYGFHEAYFNVRRYVIERKAPNLSAAGSHVFYQGLGRCLWFMEGAHPKRIANRIETFPSHFAADLWAGVGLASTYAGGADRATIEELRHLGHDYRLNIAQGCAFAAKARVRAVNVVPHTEMACRLFTGMSADQAAHITDVCLPSDSTSCHSSALYDLWRSRVSDTFESIMTRIPPTEVYDKRDYPEHDFIQ